MSKRNISRLVALTIVVVIYFANSISNSEEIKNALSPSPAPIILATPTSQVLSVESSQSAVFRVVKVIDGDTIELEGGIKLRYIGIDTPETVDPRRGVGCYGREASDKNKELVLGKNVTLEKDVSETDRYGRLLRYVYLNDVMINNELVKNGFAKAATFPPDIKYQTLFADSEKYARENGLGLWGKCF